MNLSVNFEALKIVRRMIEGKDRLGLKVDRAENGSIILDMSAGGLEGGLYVTEVCMGGLGRASLNYMKIDELTLPSIHVYTDHPSTALLGSQFAGWRIKAGKYFAMGSGPARALSLKPKELYSKIAYKDSASDAVIVLEASAKPPIEALNLICQECNIGPYGLYCLITPTSSIAGSTQISGRIAETGLHRLVELGFDPQRVLSASGEAPIASVHPDFVEAMGRTNDMLLYGGVTSFTVQYDEDATLKEVVEKAPSSASSAYGKPFAQIFREANFDFYKIDPGLFAPAVIAVNNIKTGKTFTAGHVNPDVLRRSLGL